MAEQHSPADASGEFPRVVQPPHVCDFDHRWDAERQVWLCLPNPPWFGRAYSASKHSGSSTQDPTPQRKS